MVRKGSPVQVRLRAFVASLVIHDRAGAGSEHPLDDQLTLGREEGRADLVLDDPGVSRLHARFAVDNGSVVVEDLGSSNGTYVNGQRISGPVELGAEDEVQLGGTVLSVGGAAPATEVQPAPGKRPAPKRLAPSPTERGNIPALAAVFLGPLSILLLLFSSGAAFFVSLPCAVAAVVLGTVGMRNVDRGRADSHRGLAHIGRITGVIGAILSVLALIVFLVVATALDATEDSLSGLIDSVRDEIEGVETPDINAPDVDAPDVNAPDTGGVESGGSESGGSESGGAESGGAELGAAESGTPDAP
jgi:FHA domain